jgi:hypothetical protein
MKQKRHRVDARLLCIGLLFLAGNPLFATIRSPYPAKSHAPYYGRVVFAGDDLIPAKKR